MTIKLDNEIINGAINQLMEDVPEFFRVFDPKNKTKDSKPDEIACGNLSAWMSKFYEVHVQFIHENGRVEYFVDSEEDLIKLKLML